MKRWMSRILLLVLLVLFVSPGFLPQEQVSAAGTRLVVFEGFYKVT